MPASEFSPLLYYIVKKKMMSFQNLPWQRLFLKCRSPNCWGTLHESKQNGVKIEVGQIMGNHFRSAQTFPGVNESLWLAKYFHPWRLRTVACVGIYKNIYINFIKWNKVKSKVWIKQNKKFKTMYNCIWNLNV
jgi:hypothetical protein